MPKYYYCKACKKLNEKAKIQTLKIQKLQDTARVESMIEKSLKSHKKVIIE